MPNVTATRTKVNGTAPRIAACCRATSPPTSNMAHAMPPIRMPKITVTTLKGAIDPLLAMVDMTTAAASAPLMKNNAISRTQMKDTPPPAAARRAR